MPKVTVSKLQLGFKPRKSGPEYMALITTASASQHTGPGPGLGAEGRWKDGEQEQGLRGTSLLVQW